MIFFNDVSNNIIKLPVNYLVAKKIKILVSATILSWCGVRVWQIHNSVKPGTGIDRTFLKQAMKKLSINIVFLPFFLPVVFTSWQKFDDKKVESNKIKVVRALAGANSKTAITRWTADAANAQINFVVGGPFGKVHGRLGGLKSLIQFDQDNLSASSFTASVNPKSIRTGIGLRNHDLQKEKFFDSNKYPLISFQSEKIQKTGTAYNAIGSLTIKGVTRPVQIPFTFTEKGNSGLFKGSFTIHREDFGVGNKGGSVGNDVDITLEVPVSKTK